MESFNFYVLLCLFGALFGGAIVLSITRSLSGMHYPQYGGYPGAPGAFEEVSDRRDSMNSMNAMFGFFMFMMMTFFIFIAFQYLKDLPNDNGNLDLPEEEFVENFDSFDSEGGAMEDAYFNETVKRLPGEKKADDPYHTEEWRTDFDYEVDDWGTPKSQSISNDYWDLEEEDMDENEGVYIKIRSYGSFNKANEEKKRLKNKLNKSINIGTINDELNAYYQVLVGPFMDMEIAEDYRQSIGIKGSYLIEGSKITLLRP